MKTCISTYSFWQAFCAGRITYPEMLRKTKELGCTGIEFVVDDVAPDKISDPEAFWTALKEEADKLGLETPIYTTGANFFQKDVRPEIERVKKHVDLASKLGIKLMRHDIAYGFYPEFEGVQTYESIIPVAAPAIREVAEYAASKGVTTCSENHGRLMQDSDRMLAMFKAVDHPNYRYLCDIGNFGGADEDCAAAVSKLLPHICFVHAKDSFIKSGMTYDPGRGFNRTRGGNFRRSTILGHGDVPVYQILTAIKKSGYDGYVSLEFEGIEETMMAVEISAENLKRMIKDINAQ